MRRRSRSERRASRFGESSAVGQFTEMPSPIAGLTNLVSLDGAFAACLAASLADAYLIVALSA